MLVKGSGLKDLDSSAPWENSPHLASFYNLDLGGLQAVSEAEQSVTS